MSRSSERYKSLIGLYAIHKGEKHKIIDQHNTHPSYILIGDEYMSLLDTRWPSVKILNQNKNE
tara:strand:+ start:867 stop:1055 length:189 start_codon:yes stop_codon:yes gene_type:complete